MQKMAIHYLCWAQMWHFEIDFNIKQSNDAASTKTINKMSKLQKNFIGIYIIWKKICFQSSKEIFVCEDCSSKQNVVNCK